MLAKSEETLREKLKYVEGKVEMGLRVVWDVPNIFEYFVGNHPDLRATRDQVLGGNRVPRQAEKIELGAMFERIMNEDRESHYLIIDQCLLLHACLIIISSSTSTDPGLPTALWSWISS